ncbi:MULTISPECIES: signal recognition particle-docking protein FtsY [Hymenobacter]|uniref:Signal recognition particle receptor FtsY n=2 Tax=Hymenobacter TaxID=89966 RepID=A0ABS6X4M0_9BACT|nr:MULTISPECIES: signal recognition particle-docking protein FtsY [Hymenobacter]MBO3270165.1 signal recognition particle-docking protein FtsY [Hymenobacter defluvii]MBW3130779.1 signal recognition particle-docking protein FtsY [Hymenobacter profundi]QNE41033.1 signal recognition particle-docking protein FtsY [Hymenobacter sp. NBH84]
MGLFDFFKKDKESKEQQQALDEGLQKTKTNFFDQLSKAVVGKSTVDEAVLDDLETLLVHADVGIDTTVKVIDRIEKRVARDKYVSTGDLDRILREEIAGLLMNNKSGSLALLDRPDNTGQPYVIMVVGVNGVGKTTTIGKLAHRFHSAGKKVVLGAADTFRAAAVDQLIIWGERVGVPVISHGMNTDPASVAYDAVKKGVEMQADVVIIDTAGRLHNKVNLMNELSKIKRVMQKVIPDAPHEVLLVLDGSTGQNAFLQAKEFTKATEVSALAITKLDGTAKGGVVIGISDQLNVPVRYIGVGEKMTDLQLFDKHTYVNSLFSKK